MHQAGFAWPWRNFRRCGVRIITKFELYDIVRILELETKGRVLSFWTSETGTQYEVRYFLEGKIEKGYFFGDELSACHP